MVPKPSPKNDQPKIRNSINHDDGALRKLLDGLDSKSAGQNSPNREFVRWPYRVAAVEASIYHEGSATNQVYLACRNLSAGGISLLHRAYLHKGTKVSLKLPKVNGDSATVPGFVVRCQHVQGTIHELGVKFEHQVQARDFVKIDAFADGFSLERVNPEELKGNILYIEDSPMDQSLIRHYLRETQIRLQFAATKEEAAAKAAEGPDLILCDYNLNNEDCGAEVVTQLRSMGVSVPIIMLTADTSSATREKLIRAQADAFISKPLSKSTLFRAVAEFMINDASNAAGCTLAADHPNRGLIPTFVSQVRDYVKVLEGTIVTNDVAKCRNICLQIAGTAPVMGFEKLASSAVKAEQAVSASMNVVEASVAVKTLMSACLHLASKSAA